METPVEFKAFIEFLQKEFNLKAGDYQLSFNDEDGDEIAIVSDSDLQVMNEVYSGKDYVKVVINLNS